MVYQGSDITSYFLLCIYTTTHIYMYTREEKNMQEAYRNFIIVVIIFIIIIFSFPTLPPLPWVG